RLDPHPAAQFAPFELESKERPGKGYECLEVGLQGFDHDPDSRLAAPDELRHVTIVQNVVAAQDHFAGLWRLLDLQQDIEGPVAVVVCMGGEDRMGECGGRPNQHRRTPPRLWTAPHGWGPCRAPRTRRSRLSSVPDRAGWKGSWRICGR